MRNEGSGRGWIGGLLFSVAASSLAQPQPSVDEILAHVAETYENLQSYQFQMLEVPAQRTVRLSAILPEKFYLQTMPGDARCITDGDTTWHVDPKRPDGRASVRPATVFEQAICAQQFKGAGNAFVDRWKTIVDWATLATIRGQGSMRINGSTVKCWIVEIHPRISGERVELWVDQSRYLVLREIYESHLEHRKIRRYWKDARIDTPPSESLFRSPVSKNATHLYGLTGKPAPDFTLVDLSGGEVALSAFRGRVVALYFWPTHVQAGDPDLFPGIEALYRDPQYQDVEFVTVIPQKAGAVPDFLRKRRISLAAAADPDRKIRTAFEVDRFADLILIGKDGVIAQDFQGRLNPALIRRALDDLR
jgi:peroxiredoxin/outer membrane lipoprotein-sorting protein